MEPTGSTDESTQSGKQITESKHRTLRCFCRDFDYELSDDFGPGLYTLACWLTHNDEPYFGPSSWPGPEDENKKQRCRVRGNNEIIAYVVVDGVKSNELRWTQPG